MKRRALVLGGSGYVGGAVVREMRARDVDVWCTYFRGEGSLAALAAVGARALRCDLADADAVTSAVNAAGADGPVDILVHAAGHFAGEAVLDVTTSGFDRVMQLAVRAPFLAVQEMMRACASATAAAAGNPDNKSTRVDVVIIGALDAGQSLPLPPHFAAGEGAKSALAMALAKELGHANVRVNVVSVGLLEGGMSAALSDSMAKDFASFSALGRRGKAEEVAKVVAFIALDSDFLSAKTIPVNGGL